MTEERISGSTLDKYYRVAAPKEERGTGPKNEIRISQRSDRVGQYIMYAINLFLKDNEDSVIIKAAGNAAVKCVLVAEILRHRIPDLHQINRITQTEIKDLYKPKEEGLDPVTITKILPVLEIKLTKKPTSQELNDASYQKPLPADQVEKVDLENPRPVRKAPQRDGPRGQDRDYDDERPRRGGQGRGGRRGGNRYRRGGPRGGPRDEQRGKDDFYKQDAPKDFEPENFRRGAPQQKRDDRDTERREQGGRRDDDYNRGGYRGGQRDQRRDNYQEDRDRDFRGGNRGGYRGGYNDKRRDDYDNRRFDDREERGFRGGNRGYGGRRDDYEDRRYDDREERGDDRPRGGFRGGRGGRGGFRGGPGMRGGFRNRGGNF